MMNAELKQPRPHSVNTVIKNKTNTARLIHERKKFPFETLLLVELQQKCWDTK